MITVLLQREVFMPIRAGCMRAAAAGLAAWLICGAPAQAHHSFAMFDVAQEKSLAGTIVDFEWTNPHTWIWLEAPAAGGGSEKWGIEGMSPNFLERRGWSKDTLTPGDKVTIVFHPVKNGGKGGSFMSMTLPDGTVKDMMGGPPAGAPAPK